MATLKENINKATSDFDSIKTAIEEKGVEVPYGTDTREYADKIRAISYDPATVVPLTVTENGVYDAGKGGYNPVEVKVEQEIKPLTVEKNGVYEAEEGVGYSPVAVAIPRSLREYFKFKGTCRFFFYGQQQECIPDGLIEYSDLSDCSIATDMFAHSSKLKETPHLDMRSASNFNAAFLNCSAIEGIWFCNIKVSLQVASGDTYGHLLTVESLIHLIRELRNGSNQRILTIGNVNLAKLANVYVRLIDITDEMRAKDDLIDEKLPFEICESTDEEAMLIVDYAALKNWDIQ